MINEIIRRLTLKIDFTSFPNFPRYSTEFVKHKLFGNGRIRVVEIGTATGINAENLLKELPIETLYCIDNYKETEEYPETKRWELEGNERLSQYPNVKMIKEDSSVVADCWSKGKVDFIYIDGSHKFENVIKDIEKWFPHLKKGGVIAGHDIMNHRGVSDAVIKFCYENKLSPIFNKEDWVIIKEEKE